MKTIKTDEARPGGGVEDELLDPQQVANEVRERDDKEARENAAWTIEALVRRAGRSEQSCALGTEPSQAVRSSAWLGVDLIRAERERQISGEGWGPEHDDTHDKGEMIMAADCYARTAQAQVIGLPLRDAENVEWWPWAVDGWWKPDADPMRNLVKAGALIAAEIDRLDRERRKTPNDGTERRGEVTP